MSPAAYCVRGLVERIGAARGAGRRVEPLPGAKRGEYGNFYDAYLKDGWGVEDLERVLDRLVERASGKNGEWIKFGWAAADVEAGRQGTDPGRGRRSRGGGAGDDRRPDEDKNEARERRAADRRRQMDEVFGTGARRG